MKRNRLEIIAFVCIIIGLGVFVYYVYQLVDNNYIVGEGLSDKDIERTAYIGDFFGGVIGSIWALAGVLLYFSALKLQSKEIANQINEMNENKKMMFQQQFDSTFFSLLSNQYEMKKNINGYFFQININNFRYSIDSQQYSLDNFFKMIRYEMFKIYEILKDEDYNTWEETEIERMIDEETDEAVTHYKDDTDKTIKNLIKSLNKRYRTYLYSIKKDTHGLTKIDNGDLFTSRCVYGYIYMKYVNELSHYCRYLYNILKYVDQEKERYICDINNIYNNDIIAKERNLELLESRFERYISFIHSSLSSSELFVLYYNSLLFPKAQELLVKYHFFDNLLCEFLLKKEHASFVDGVNLKDTNSIFESIINYTD